MRAFKAMYLAMLIALWWLTTNGYHSVPIDRGWFVFLSGTTIGFFLGCCDSRHTYHFGRGDQFHFNFWWHFISDCGWIVVCGFIAGLLIEIRQEGCGVWFSVGMLPAFLYFAWPREEADPYAACG